MSLAGLAAHLPEICSAAEFELQHQWAIRHFVHIFAFCQRHRKTKQSQKLKKQNEKQMGFSKLLLYLTFAWTSNSGRDYCIYNNFKIKNCTQTFPKNYSEAHPLCSLGIWSLELAKKYRLLQIFSQDPFDSTTRCYPKSNWSCAVSYHLWELGVLELKHVLQLFVTLKTIVLLSTMGRIKSSLNITGKFKNILFTTQWPGGDTTEKSQGIVLWCWYIS